MGSVDLKKVLKKCSIYYAFFGLALNIILYWVEPNMPFHFGNSVIYGFKAFAVGLISLPLIMGVVGFVHDLVIWYPMCLLFNHIKNKSSNIKRDIP